jgi:hypothetical protein
MYFAIMISTDQLSSSNIVWDPNVVDKTVLANFILTSSRGLLEFVEPGTRCGFESVQIIHESVREYLLMHGLHKLDEDLGQNTEGKCYGRLARWCTKYIQSTVQFGLFGEGEQARSMRQCPLLDHATQYCLTYVTRAAEQECRQSVYAEAPIETWRLIADIHNPRPNYELPAKTVHPDLLKSLSADRTPVCTTMLHLSILYRLPGLADIDLEQNAKRDAKQRQMYLDTVCLCADVYGSKSYRSGCSALGMVVPMVRVRMTRALLHEGANANVNCERHGSPLEVALRCVQDQIDDRIEEDEEDEEDSEFDYDECVGLPNFLRAELEITRLLLQNGATSPIDRPIEIESPLLRAIETKDWAMVKSQLGVLELWDDS